MNMVAELGRKLQLPMEEDCQKSFMQLNEEFGSGMIASYETNRGLDTVVFHCRFKQDIELRLGGTFSLPLFFYTVGRGNVHVTCETGSFDIGPLQGTIHGAYGAGLYTIHLPAEEDLLIMLSLVHRKLFFEEIDCGVIQVPPELLRVVSGNTREGQQFLFQDIFHLPAVDAVRDVVNHTERGLLHSAHASAKIYENMFLLLNEYKRLHERKYSRLVRDATKINTIRAAEKIISTRLQDPPTIPMLAKMVGINQQTLKMGFRQLYGKTINNYLNDRRLDQAGMLISTGGMSIAEVASAVGYSNGGYFSRKFKQKYGVTPSKFTSST